MIFFKPSDYIVGDWGHESRLKGLQTFTSRKLGRDVSRLFKYLLEYLAILDANIS